MTYRGKVKGGVVVLDASASIPEGTEVNVEPLAEHATATDSNLGKSLMELAGKAVGLPADASRNHDHYLYGTPKK